MKKIIVPIFILCFVTNFINAQNNPDYISTLRMGPFKLDEYQSDVEKFLGYPLKKHSKDENMDTSKIVYNNIKYNLVFQQEYTEDTSAIPKFKLYSISSNNTTIKTKSLIGIGSTKAEILSVYDKYSLNIYNDYMYKEKNIPKDKIQYIILTDIDSSTQICFKTENRIVTEIEVSYAEGD